MDWEQNDLTQEQREEFAEAYWKQMIYGILWVVGGVLVVIAMISSRNVSKVGFIAWGSILYGIFNFFRGLGGWIKYR